MADLARLQSDWTIVICIAALIKGLRMSTQVFDVVVVGASLAGCTTAVLLAREGVKVAVVERHAKPDTHKQLCTHFIQASALPVLQRLGVDRLIEEAGGVRNPIEIHSPSGWMGFHLGSRPDGGPHYGYNIRRLRLDPMMRDLAAGTPGVTMLTGTSAKATGRARRPYRRCRTRRQPGRGHAACAPGGRGRWTKFLTRGHGRRAGQEFTHYAEPRGMPSIGWRVICGKAFVALN
jgi:choline dehydrogenase-like flavoprotein